MNKDDFVRFGNALGVLSEIHGKKLSPLAIKAYFQALEKFSVEEVEAVISNSIGKNKFFPKPAELIELISGGKDDIETIAMTQATNVLNAIKDHGGYKSICFDDAFTNAVILKVFGGWQKVCQEMEVLKEQWFLKDFAKYYRAYRIQGIKEYGRLIGMLEHQNELAGYDVKPKTVLIGDADKATQIAFHAKPKPVQYLPDKFLPKLKLIGG